MNIILQRNTILYYSMYLNNDIMCIYVYYVYLCVLDETNLIYCSTARPTLVLPLRKKY